MKRRRVVKLAYVLIAAIAFLLATEVICRVGEKYFVPEDGRVAVDLLLGRWTVPGRLSPHPFMLYVNTPSFAADGFQQHNSQGYRGGEIVPCEPPCLRILALGGSTTYGHLLANPADAWPAQLEKELNDAGFAAQVINGGFNYATTAELLTHWIFRDRYLSPNLVVLHGPGNDVVPLLFDEYDPEYAAFRRGWTGVSFSRRAGERQLLRLAGARILYAWWLRATGIKPAFFWQPKEFSELRPAETLANVRRHEPLGFRRNLDLLLRAIAADGARVLYFEFVGADKSVFERPLPKEARFVEHIYDAILEGQAKENAAAQEVVRALGVPYLRLPEQDRLREHFLDNMHLDPGGEAVKAAFLAETILRAQAAGGG